MSEKMKESGVEWIGEIPEEWGVGKVKYFSEISAGGTPNRNVEEYWNGHINWMASGEVNQRKVIHTLEKITELGLRNSAAKLLPKGTVVLALNGQGKTKGMAAILDIEASSNQSLASFIVDEINLHNRYLWYYFLANYKNIRAMKGEGRDGLNLQLVSNIQLPIPSFAEQRHISDYLDKQSQRFDQATNLIKAEITQLCAYKKSLIYETVTKGLDKNVQFKDSGVDWIGEIPVGWEVKKFKYFFETTKGLSITKEKLTDKGIPVISYGQIHSKYGRKVDSTKDLLPFVPEDYLRYKQALLTKGNFIFADTSEDIEGSGNFSTRTDGEGRLFAGYHTIIARLLDTKNNDFRYVMYLFDSEWFRNQIRHSVSGVKVFSITQSILKNTTILFPIALAEQKAIADYLDKKIHKINEIIKIKEQQLTNLSEQRKTLIYEVITGKRRISENSV